MTENQVPAWTPAGDLTAVPANDNQLRALGAAIGRVEPCRDATRYDWLLQSVGAANDNLPPVVAFTGIAGSGKSTATRYLVEQYGYTLVKFAGPLKDMMRAIGFSEAQIEGDLKETPTRLLQGKTPRHAMQTLGTQWGRDCIGKDFWIELWVRSANIIMHGGGRVVVDDCRFPNEAKAIRELGGDIYKLIGRGGIAGDHVSERGCGDQDLTIANIWDEPGLFRQVDEALRRFG